MSITAFGVIVVGRMVQTNFAPVKEGEYVIELSDAESINHLVVFLTGAEPLPNDYGASIYINLPGSGDGEIHWNYIGYLSNKKSSALFKIGQLNKSAQQIPKILFHGFNQNNISENAILGIKLEPLNEIIQRVEAEKTMPIEQSSMTLFVERMLRNFCNFVQSFTVITIPKPENGQLEEYLPAKAVNEWFANFQRRLQMDPNFWKYLP